jgi:hypothetical protein
MSIRAHYFHPGLAVLGRRFVEIPNINRRITLTLFRSEKDMPEGGCKITGYMGFSEALHNEPDPASPPAATDDPITHSNLRTKAYILVYAGPFLWAQKYALRDRERLQSLQQEGVKDVPALVGVMHLTSQECAAFLGESPGPPPSRPGGKEADDLGVFFNVFDRDTTPFLTEPNENAQVLHEVKGVLPDGLYGRFAYSGLTRKKSREVGGEGSPKLGPRQARRLREREREEGGGLGFGGEAPAFGLDGGSDEAPREESPMLRGRRRCRVLDGEVSTMLDALSIQQQDEGDISPKAGGHNKTEDSEPYHDAQESLAAWGRPGSPQLSTAAAVSQELCQSSESEEMMMTPMRQLKQQFERSLPRLAELP